MEISPRYLRPTPAVDPAQVAEIREMIRNSRRPCIYAGGGIISAEASAELVRFAEGYHIPVVTTLGQDTLSIYLLHGLLVQLLRLKYRFLLSEPWQVLVVWLLLLLLLGNPIAGRCVSFLFGAGWYRRLQAMRAEKRQMPDA